MGKQGRFDLKKPQADAKRGLKKAQRKRRRQQKREGVKSVKDAVHVAAMYGGEGDDPVGA